jgi:hypothetical protein
VYPTPSSPGKKHTIGAGWTGRKSSSALLRRNASMHQPLLAAVHSDCQFSHVSPAHTDQIPHQLRKAERREATALGEDKELYVAYPKTVGK